MSSNPSSNQAQPEYGRLPEAGPGSGYVSEMICSIQGEGPFTGERQVFVRTAGCTETCSWCDTVYSKIQTPRFVIHGKVKRALPNPLPAGVVVAEAVAFAASQGTVRTVSITGGEPLEQPVFVTELAQGLQAAEMRVYLETAGMHADAFATVLPFVDVVAMDIKLPSAIGRDAWDDHRKFLGAIRGTAFDPGEREPRTLFVKVVVGANTAALEVVHAAEIIAETSPRILLVLQPESGALLSERAPRERAVRVLELCRRAQQAALEVLDEVRVMPQSHRILGVR